MNSLFSLFLFSFLGHGYLRQFVDTIVEALQNVSQTDKLESLTAKIPDDDVKKELEKFSMKLTILSETIRTLWLKAYEDFQALNTAIKRNDLVQEWIQNAEMGSLPKVYR